MAKKDLQTSLRAAARLLGRKGGKKGGPKRAELLTQGQRTEIARKGGLARHGKTHV
jgi:hypothetical protein